MYIRIVTKLQVFQGHHLSSSLLIKRHNYVLLTEDCELLRSENRPSIDINTLLTNPLPHITGKLCSLHKSIIRGKI